MNSREPTKTPAVTITNAALERDGRTLWKQLNLAVQPGEFIAVLGPNGAGKTSLLKLLLGLIQPTSGNIAVFGTSPHRGNSHIGYIPQQKGFDADTPIRGRDLVELGVTGAQYGIDGPHQSVRTQVDAALAAVGATTYGDMPLGLLSGGEQQRIRIAQALVGRPELLLCDEPLLSLDVTSQQTVTKLIDNYRRQRNASVIFVTHEINPVLHYVDRILYLTTGRWAFDTPETVLQSDVLSSLYGSPIEVLRTKGRIIVIGTEDAPIHHGGNA
jgi:zinc/manganese transport system ATP-binding protein